MQNQFQLENRISRNVSHPPSSLQNSLRQRQGQYKKVIYDINGEKFKIWSYFKPVKIIGHGAYAVVIEAKDTRIDGRRVAIKKNKNIFVDLADSKRILREIKLLMAFDHDDIIKVLDIIPPSIEDGINSYNDIYLVMPRMETTLKRVIKSGQKLEHQHHLFFVYQILRGLKYIHSAGVIHRDLKPENILVNGKNCNVKISDFGLSRDIYESASLLTEYVITRWYRAPEVMICAKNYNEKVDVWAVGCIFAELLLGKELFPGNNHFEQLSLIFSIIGTPSKNDLKWVSSPDARLYIKQLEYQTGHDLRKIFKNAEPEAIDLISSMLVINPYKRITVPSSLSHPFFSKLHHPKSEKTINQKIKNELIESFKLFEGDKISNTKNPQNNPQNGIYKMRHLIYKTITNFNPSWRRKQRQRQIQTDRAVRAPPPGQYIQQNKNSSRSNKNNLPPPMNPNKPPKTC